MGPVKEFERPASLHGAGRFFVPEAFVRTQVRFVITKVRCAEKMCDEGGS